MLSVNGKEMWLSPDGRMFPVIRGGSPTLEELYTEREEVIAEAEGIIKDLDGAAPEGDNEEKLRSLTERHDALATSIEKAKEAAKMVEDFAAARTTADADADAARSAARPPVYAGAGKDETKTRQAVTPGEMFVESDVYKEWVSRFPNGGPAKQMDAWSAAQNIGVYRHLLGMLNATERLRGILTPTTMRSLLTSDDASAGELVLSLRRGLIEPGLVRPLTVRDLVTVIPVSTDTVEYVAELSRVTNAAPTAEAAALTGTSGTKPEGGLTFEARSDTVKTIAEWVPATKRILADAPELRAYIDQYLSEDLAEELEDQMISGSGAGEDFLGILNNPDIQTAGPAAGTQNILDVIRVGKRLVRTTARTNATGVLINPEDLETIDILKAGAGAAGDGGGPYYGSNPFQFNGNTRLWGLPLVDSEAVPVGTALVGDFRRAVLFDRESTGISVGTAGDDFIRNIVRVLAELRAGFGVIRPTAFVACDLT